MKTMICLILDRSGSMGGREDDVVGGVNAFLEEQKKLPDPASVSMVRFDSQSIEFFRARGPLIDTAPLTRDEYQPRGGTPLLDAVGRTIMDLEVHWKNEQPERAIVVIVTDGAENESREYTKAKVKALIDARQASGLWAFIYLGANVDAFAEAGAMGFSAHNTANYTNTAAGTASAYGAMSASVSMKRASGQMMNATTLGGDIQEDGSLTNNVVDTTGTAAMGTAKTWTVPLPDAATWTPPTK